MSRRWTGWVLTAAVIAAGPAPALSSNDPINDLGQDFRPTVAHLGSTQPLREGIQSLAGDDGDYTNCLEVTPREFMVLRNGTVQQPQSGLPTMAAGKGPPVDIYIPEHRVEGIVGEIARAKRGAADQATPGVRPEHVKAACGIPRGFTVLVPAMRELHRAGGAMS